MLKVCLKILECERKFRVWKEWISVIGNDGGAIGIKGVENKALKPNTLHYYKIMIKTHHH